MNVIHKIQGGETMTLVGICPKCGSKLFDDKRRYTLKQHPAYIYCKKCDCFISYDDPRLIGEKKEIDK